MYMYYHYSVIEESATSKIHGYPLEHPFNKVNTHTHARMHTHTRTYAHTHTHAHTRMHTHACTHTHTHACTHTHQMQETLLYLYTIEYSHVHVFAVRIAIDTFGQSRIHITLTVTSA